MNTLIAHSLRSLALLAICALIAVPAFSYAQITAGQNASGTASTTQTSASTTVPGDQFVSLTQLPGITGLSNSLINAESLPDLFNSLYRICIGAAAVIAVIQIMRAGVKFMTSKDSAASNKDAKDMIRNAVLGLVLVLSPAIVFGLINPRILDLELDISALQPRDLEDVDLRPGEVECGSIGENGVPYVCDDNNSPAQTVTGTLLRTGTFKTEAAMNTFIGQCSATAKETLINNIKAQGGTAITRGCTQTCSPAGSGSCDAKGCSQYTAYCSVRTTLLLNESDQKPHTLSAGTWETFTTTCIANGGNPKYGLSGVKRECIDYNTDKIMMCLDAVVSCEPK